MTDSERIEEEGLAHLARIESELEEIKERTPTHRKAFLTGILQGSGAVLGGILAVILLGWLLYLIGIVPGFQSVAHYVQDAEIKIGR